MTGGDANKAEIEIDMGGDAVEQAKELAKELDNAAEKQEELTKAAERYARVMTSLRKQRGQEEQRQSREVRHRSSVTTSLARQRDQEETQAARERRSSVLGSLGRQRQREERADREQQQVDREKKRADREQQQVDREKKRADRQRALEGRRSDAGIADRRAAKIEQEKRVESRMEAMGYGKQRETVEEEAQRQVTTRQRRAAVNQRVRELGGGGPEQPSTAAEAKGIGKDVAGSFGAPTAAAGAWLLAAHAARSGLSSNVAFRESPYADYAIARREQFRSQLPVLGDAILGVSDLATGRATAVGRTRAAMDQRQSRAQAETAAYRYRTDSEVSERVAINARDTSLSSNPMPRLPDTARSTVSEKQRYAEASRLLPLEVRLTKLKREQAKTQDELAEASSAERKEATRLDELNENKVRLARGYQAMFAAGKAGTPEMGSHVGVMKINNQQIEESTNALVSLKERRRDAELRNVEARGRTGEGEESIRGEKIDQLRQREGTAENQAFRLGMMSHGDRLRGQFAMQLAASGGVDMMSSEMKEAGLAYGGESFRKHAIDSGSKYVGEARASGAGEEYRDTLPEIRKQVNDAVKGNMDLSESLAQSIVSGIAEAMKGLGSEIGKFIQQKGETQWQKNMLDGLDQGSVPKR